MDEWGPLARLVADQWGTPAYVFQGSKIDTSLQELEGIASPLPVRHWLSCKTLALRPLLSHWKKLSGGVEVVSPFELRAALSEGFDGDRILVNGSAKHRWLATVDTRRLHVQFDSLREIDALGPLATAWDWHVGVRVHTDENRDPDNEEFFDHFGISSEDVPKALDALAGHKVRPRCVSFHLHSNLRTVDPFMCALEEVAATCSESAFCPEYLDIGGGLPVPGAVSGGRDGAAFDFKAMSRVYGRASELFPSVCEVWLENGSFISGRAGALVIRVWDVKYRGAMRYLICDGGRVNHALPSDWETHRITSVPERLGDKVETTVCGPTCMAYDILARTSLPAGIEPGDLLIWHTAGAYHLAWETRFSFGSAPIVWVGECGLPELVRSRESFESWWAFS